MASPAETAAMRRALDLARAADVPPNPNPDVGCVLLTADGRGGGRGVPSVGRARRTPRWLRWRPRRPAAARGGTAVVTLEPCTGSDRAGRCAESLLEAGVARVVFGQSDPNPAVAGGAEFLRAAGIDVEGGVLADEAQALNPFWSLAMLLGRPVVTWKLAASLDGRSAAADGTSRWITGVEARRDVHRLRAGCDAVLVGTGTALADDPHLTVRDAADRPLPADRQPLRVVMGRRELPATAHLRDGEATTLQIDTHDPAEALRVLHDRKIRHVWLEGGPTVAGAFVRAGLVDEVIAYVAPLLLGAGALGPGRRRNHHPRPTGCACVWWTRRRSATTYGSRMVRKD